MKQIIFTLVLVAVACFASVEAQAQEITIGASGIKFNEDVPSEEPVTVCTIVRYSDNALKVSRIAHSTIPTFELGWNIPTNVGYSAYEGLDTGEFFDLRHWKSVQATFNIAGATAFSKNLNVGIAAAVGFKWNNYRFEPDMTLVKDGGLIMPSAIADRNGKSSKKSKFTTAALHIPVELIFGNPHKLALSVGGYVDMTINNHTKIKYYGGHKDKTWNYPVNFIQAGAVARLTFHHFSVFCSYQPTQLFKTGRGPEMQQWTIGLGF